MSRRVSALATGGLTGSVTDPGWGSVLESLVDGADPEGQWLLDGILNALSFEDELPVVGDVVEASFNVEGDGC